MTKPMTVHMIATLAEASDDHEGLGMCAWPTAKALRQRGLATFVRGVGRGSCYVRITEAGRTALSGKDREKE